MNVEMQKRIDKIRAKVREERAAVADLDRKVTDLKQTLKPASDLLDDIEMFFLEPEILRQPRTDREWSYWLGNTERVLLRAIERREYVVALVAKFGPDARIIGGS